MKYLNSIFYGIVISPIVIISIILVLFMFIPHVVMQWIKKCRDDFDEVFYSFEKRMNTIIAEREK